MSKRNSFITHALEELQSEAVAGSETPAASAAPATSETNMDTTGDAVAELMEKNTDLSNDNAELQSESFDNDVDAIETTSDSVSEDLTEAVQATVALENLADLCYLTLKSGQANAAAVAGLAFGLEQITNSLNMPSSVAALESETLSLDGPKEQVAAIGKAAEEKSESIFKRIIESIKRIIEIGRASCRERVF